MAVNNYKEHLLILLEDKPYRDIVNGVTLSSNVNDGVIKIENPCGGWEKVFEKLEKELKLLEKFSQRKILALIDFDDKKDDEISKFEKRYQRFEKLVSTYHNRVFLLGVNHKESENLKTFFRKGNFEEIGQLLVDGCPNSDLGNWKNEHLECNLVELDRMKQYGVFDLLFK